MKDRLLGRSILAIEVAILVGVTVHAPLTVWLGTLFPEYSELIKSWKELLMGLCLLLVAVYVTRRHSWSDLWRDWLIRLSAGYALLHMALLAWQPQAALAAGVGMMIDLRYALFFVMVYVTARYIVVARRTLLIAALIGAAIVIGFAALQITVLPDDILASIGYSKQTIAPYLTVDLNHAYIRINSTLRGPNPVGAYAGMCLALSSAYLLVRRDRLTRQQWIGGGLLAVGSVAALWASYSRSAVVAAIAMVVVVTGVASARSLKQYWQIGVLAFVVVLIAGVASLQNHTFVSNVLLHENPNGGSAQKSNEGHVDSLHDGLLRMTRQPLGGGIGSTGSASLQSGQPLTIENQYLFVAHETGWLGLMLFVGLFGMVLWRLWLRRSDWLALGVLASGIGLALIGLLLPVWADDTVAIIWWGLAGLAIGYTGEIRGKKRTRH